MRDTKHIDIMLDLETAGTSSGAVILAIAATTFGVTAPLERLRFFVTISVEDSLEEGFYQDADTLNWWGKQPEALSSRMFGGTTSCVSALTQFSAYVSQCKTYYGVTDVRVWGNGATFDNTLLVAYYNKLHLTTPWKYSGDMCYRTLKNLLPTVKKDSFVGIPHDPVDDVYNQANHAEKLLKKLYGGR
jgi:exodeoxyribonuclease VIII